MGKDKDAIVLGFKDFQGVWKRVNRALDEERDHYVWLAQGMATNPVTDKLYQDRT